jgi:hypothetical protein
MITRLLDKQSHLNDMLSAKTAKSGGKQTVGVSVKQQQFQWKHVEAQNPMDHVGSYGMNHPQQEKTDKHKVDEWIYTTTTMELNQVT